VTDRIYRRKQVKEEPGLALCLLLDDSGSMFEGHPTRASAALRVAVLAIEAFRGIRGIELEVYSHTSTGGNDRDCLVRYLFGKRSNDCSSVGAYGLGNRSYDHQALLTAARLFEENTKHSQRVLIALSDGQPSGHMYGGDPAVQATREAAEAIRRKGMQVLNVALEDYRSEDIFGARNVVKFTDLSELVRNMRILMTRIVRRFAGRQ
jgi:nitric oxide reductase activation protein